MASKHDHRVQVERHDDDGRIPRLRKDIEELNTANYHLKRENDRLCKKLFEATDTILRLEKDASNMAADIPVVLDEPALSAARERIAELEERLAQQISLCKDALRELASTATEIEVARVVNEETTLALTTATQERDQAVNRAVKAEAALAALQRSSIPSGPSQPSGSAASKLATPLGPRSIGHGLMTPDTAARPVQDTDAQLRDLQMRYDGLLTEKSTVEAKYLQLQHKWSDFKELVQSRLSPQKPRRHSIASRPSSPSPSGHNRFVLPKIPVAPYGLRPSERASSPTKMPPTTLASKHTAPMLPRSPISPEIVETSETEDEDWDGRPLPSRTVTPAQAPPNMLPPPQSPTTPRRREFNVRVKREVVDETILVADSSPERGTPNPAFLESQTQSQSSRGWSAPPESPVRPRVSPNALKRKADEMSNGDEQTTPRKLAKAATLGALDQETSKGRGRYQTSRPSADERTINEVYQVNRAQNDGFSYEFDDVVRDKQKRKQLEGGDCECCRDYYEAIGPLPPRMQPPRWRSETPDSQQVLTSRPCLRQLEGSSEADADAAKAAIAAHKNEISRHRHQWAPAETPPDYWHIGFPTTQDVQEINRKAAKMHEEKKKHIAMEASKPNGKYKKRGR